MLKGISPLLTPELLKTLMEMGHDDALVLADANFTAVRIAAGKPVLRLPGSGMAEVVKAITDLLPLATDVEHPVAYMQVSDQPNDYQSGLQREVLAQVNPLLQGGQSAEGLERFAFYDRARDAFAVVLTGERQPFGNFILRKGVIGDNLRP
ncbi:MAG: RbsD or FucU transport [Rhodoferax sp.]|nr:MAG: RbsD or FucU transport [Rhodoferax sp.]